MNAILFKTALTLHIVGFVLWAGIMLADFFTFRQFWKLVKNDWEKAKWLRKITVSFPMLMAVGTILVLISGFGLLHFMPVEFQLWFQLKIGLLVLIILNIIFIGVRQGKKLDKLIAAGKGMEAPNEVLRIKQKLNFFHISQLIMFLAIFVLAVFKLN